MPSKTDSGDFDSYLAKMIDERLALKSKEKENQKFDKNVSSDVAMDGQAGAGSQDH